MNCSQINFKPFERLLAPKAPFTLTQGGFHPGSAQTAQSKKCCLHELRAILSRVKNM